MQDMHYTIHQLQPRCGNLDVDNYMPLTERLKREPQISDAVWPRTTLTWKVVKYSNRTYIREKRDEVDETIEAALNEWAKVSDLRFKRVRSFDKADLAIGFHKRKDDDQFEVDVLAHADYPHPDGADVHFQDEIKWSIERKKVEDKESLYAVAVHEFGHALGLNHNRNKRSIMHYNADDVFELNSDDIKNIQKLYGKPSKKKSDVFMFDVNNAADGN